MTQEEKAKAYDEAIKVIKSNLDALNEITETGANIVNIQSIRNCFYRAFPELRESEDERIRKELIEHIKANECADYVLFKKFSPDDVIAWLEKQSEQNLVLRDTFGYEDGRLFGMNEGIGLVLDNPEKYGLQKPVKWSKEDESVISLILSICNDFLESFEISPASTKVVKEDIDKIKNWLKSLKKRRKRIGG